MYIVKAGMEFLIEFIDGEPKLTMDWEEATRLSAWDACIAGVKLGNMGYKTVLIDLNEVRMEKSK